MIKLTSYNPLSGLRSLPVKNLKKFFYNWSPNSFIKISQKLLIVNESSLYPCLYLVVFFNYSKSNFPSPHIANYRSFAVNKRIVWVLDVTPLNPIQNGRNYSSMEWFTNQLRYLSTKSYLLSSVTKMFFPLSINSKYYSSSQLR